MDPHKQTKRIDTFLLISFKIIKLLLEYSIPDERVLPIQEAGVYSY
jgi:hypothetical protein